MSKQTVLVVGARGFVGSQVLDAVLRKNQVNNNEEKYTVMTLIRPGSNASAIEAKGGVGVARGDMMDATSLVTAFTNVDTVISIANGYMSGMPEVDTVGMKNVVDACKAAGVQRLVYCSILAAEKAGPGVEHFHHKALAEGYMRQQGVPFIALRPGAFLDQADDFIGTGVVQRGDSYTFSIWDKNVPIGMILTSDLAQLFADAIDLPKDANGKCIDVGWTRPMAMQEIVSIVSTKLDRNVSCYTVPWLLRVAVMYTLGWVKPLIYDTFCMCNWFSQGLYVNDTAQQRQYFGEPPTPEEAIGRYVDKLLKEKKEEEDKKAAAAAAAATAAESSSS